jgi:hypothetical protein
VVVALEAIQEMGEELMEKQISQALLVLEAAEVLAVVFTTTQLIGQVVEAVEQVYMVKALVDLAAVVLLEVVVVAAVMLVQVLVVRLDQAAMAANMAALLDRVKMALVLVPLVQFVLSGAKAAHFLPQMSGKTMLVLPNRLPPKSWL